MITHRDSGHRDPERLGIRIWEILEAHGEMTFDKLKRRLLKIPNRSIENALSWLLREGFVLQRETPDGVLLRSDGVRRRLDV